jgi:phosphoadenosine phosphosulfate reductase
MTESFRELPAAAEVWSPEEVLGWGFRTFGDEVEMATGFGVDGMVLLDIALQQNPRLKVFTGDTGFLFEETYDLIERVEQRYGIQVERLHSALTPSQQAQSHGPALWQRNPDQCCQLRKIEPLAAKLSKLKAWITAIRRDQTPDRARAGKVQWDTRFQLVKLNPIVDWTEQRVWSYARENKVPYNPLHDEHYPSVGCTHCTRSVKPGEDRRAGRWAGFDKTECGLHVEIGPAPRTPDARPTRNAFLCVDSD